MPSRPGLLAFAKNSGPWPSRWSLYLTGLAREGAQDVVGTGSGVSPLIFGANLSSGDICATARKVPSTVVLSRAKRSTSASSLPVRMLALEK